ncbi:Leucine rich repeat protein [compost metagenome]
MSEAVPPATLPAEDDSAQTFNRHIVKQCLPGWLTTDKPSVVAALATNLQTSQRAHHKVGALLKSLPTARAFAAPLLTQALHKQFGSQLNIDTDRYLKGKSVLVRDMRPIGNIEWRTDYQEQSLLQAALHNFEASEAVASNLDRLQTARPVSFLPEQFAKLCRTLDIGGKYQALLNTIFNPSADSQETAAQARARVRSQLKDSKRHDLAVATHYAFIHNQISEPVHAMLLRVSELETDVQLDGLKVHHKRLSMLGQPLTNIMLFETLTQVSRLEYAWREYKQQKLIVYIPNDPVSPLKEYTTWEACEDDLRARLGQEDYRRFFCGFVAHKEAAVFLPALESTLKQTASLRLVTHTIATEPFADRVEHAIEKVFADARFQAVPTADQDLKSLQDSRRKTEELGLNLLNIAAFFVPGLGELMFGVTAYQLLGQVYEGIEDWSDGHKQEALTDMLEVAKGLAVTALTVGAVVTTRSVYSHFFKELMPISLDHAQPRLWHMDMSPYEAEHSVEVGSNEIEPGLFKNGEQHHVRIDGKTYGSRFDEATGKWRVCHPTRTQAYAPMLEHNGAGAWRVALDNPLQWQGSAYLFKRLGDDFRQFDDNAIEQILTVTGLDENALRCIHLANAKPPGHLLDTVTRFQVDHDLTRFIDKLQSADPTRPLAESLAGLREDSAFDTVWQALDQLQHPLTTDLNTQWTQSLTVSHIAEHSNAQRYDLFDRLYRTHNHATSDTETLIRRDFPGLPLPVVRQLIESATDAERLRLSTEQRIPLRLAESARELLREVRLTRAKEGFYLDSVTNADTDKLALHLLKKLPGWPVDTRVEIRAQTQDGKLLEHIGDAKATWLGVLVKDRKRYSPAEPDELAPPLSSGRPHSLFSGLFGTVRIENIESADDLRLALVKLAASQRQDAERILGLTPRQPNFNPPRRLGSNRFGYQLSGRGDPAPARQSNTGLVRKLYPDYSNLEIDQFLFSLRISGANVREVLQQREKQYLLFDLALSRWEREPGTSSSTRVRAQVSNLLRRCWRRQTPRLDHPDGRLLGYRLSLEASHPGQLPELPEGTDLSHVVDLNLYGMQLSQIPDGFLRHFSATRWLDLGNNSLDQLPAVIRQMSELRALNLQSNQIRLRTADILDLGQLRQLEELNLSGNPLGEVPDVTRLRHLQILRLRDTGIEQLPNGLLDRQNPVNADLRDNLIRELPEGLFGATPQVIQRIFLHDNPLSDASRRRLATFQHNHGRDMELAEQAGDATSLDGTSWLPATNDPLRLQK